MASLFLSKRWSCGKGQRGTQIPNLSVDQLSLFIIIFDSSAKSEKPQIFTTQLKHETEEEYPYAGPMPIQYTCVHTMKHVVNFIHTIKHVVNYIYTKTRSTLYIHN